MKELERIIEVELHHSHYKLYFDLNNSCYKFTNSMFGLPLRLSLSRDSKLNPLDWKS